MGEKVQGGETYVSAETSGNVGRVTLFEALAQDLGPDAVGLSRSNHTTQPPADYDDQ